MKSKLAKGDELTMEMVDQFLGIPTMQKRVIPHKNYIVIVDLNDDLLYILSKTGKVRNRYKDVFKVVNIFVWSRVIEVLLKGGC